MKKLNLSLILILSALNFTQTSVAQASSATTRTTTVFGNTTDFGYCSGFNFDFCIEQLKANTERDATEQMTMSCSAQAGTLQSFPYCSTNCFPFYLPQNAPMQSANCSSQCTGTCEIQQFE